MPSASFGRIVLMHRSYTGGFDTWFRDHEAHRVCSLFCHALRPPLTNLLSIGYNGLLLGLDNRPISTRYSLGRSTRRNRRQYARSRSGSSIPGFERLYYRAISISDSRFSHLMEPSPVCFMWRALQMLPWNDAASVETPGTMMILVRCALDAVTWNDLCSSARRACQSGVSPCR